MASRPENFYDLLGVPRDAKLTDIGRAYNNLRASMKRDEAPPDPRREALIEEAFRTLSDPERRDAYDASLTVRTVAGGKKRAGIAAGIAAAVVAGAFFVMRGPAEPPRKAGRPVQEVLAEASRAVGRVDSFEMSGRATPLGLAVVVEPGVLVTSCAGIVPGAQLAVNLPPRSVPARVALADEALGLCKLAVEGAGSWPLAVGGAEPRSGDQVYAASLNPPGEVVLAEATVRRVLADAKGRVIESSVPVAPGAIGGPLLDAYGRIVGIAIGTNAAGEGRHLALPAAWVAQDRTPASAAAPPESASAAAPAPAPSASGDPAGVDAAKYREELGKSLKGTGQERWGEKLRPPPKVPDSL